jgi:purine-binding chemotaxis protein CheW
VRTRADELREVFDDAFARPAGAGAAAGEELLAIRIAGEPYALHRAELAGLYADKVITPLPGDVRGLRGIAGFRGALVPVYDLATLLGAKPAASARWLVVAAAEPVALAFDAFDAFVRVEADAIAPAAGTADHIRHAARTPSGLRPIVDLATILDVIRARARSEKG